MCLPFVSRYRVHCCVFLLSGTLAGCGCRDSIPKSNGPSQIEASFREGFQGAVLTGAVKTQVSRDKIAEDTRPEFQEASGAVVYMQSSGHAQPSQERPVILRLFDSKLVPDFTSVRIGQHVVVKYKDGEPHLMKVSSLHQRVAASAVPPDPTEFRTEFEAPEDMVIIHCALHPGEKAVVTVVPSLNFVISDDKGFFKFPVPLRPGSHVIRAFHPSWGRSENTIEIQQDQEVARVELELAWKKQE